jgi:hypothetical protein
MLRRYFILAEWTAFDWWRLIQQSEMAQRRRTAEDEQARLATREEERRRSLVVLDEAIHEIAKSWANPHVADAKLIKRLQDRLDRARRAWKE